MSDARAWIRPRLRPAVLASALILSLPAALVPSAPAVAAPAITCTLEGDFDGDVGDVDGDSLADPAVGLPTLGDGAVDVHGTHVGAVRVTESDLGVTEPSGDFGTAITAGFANDDFCGDLVVSAPGNGSVAGSVYLIPGSDTGLVLSAAVRLRAPSGVGTSWGTALALAPDRRVLAVGAPASALSVGGAVYLSPLGADATPTTTVAVSQGANGVPGASEAGDRFGAVLASDSDVLAIGAPGEAVGSRKEAGSVTLLNLTGATTYTAFALTQDTATVPGTAEAGDRFGAALATMSRQLVVGAPGETVGSAKHTGLVDLVQITQPDAQGRVKVARVHQWTQDSARVPGANESGDQWGWSVAVGVGDEDVKIWVGAPYEDNGKAKDSGSVTMIGMACSCTGTRYLQGAAPLGGKAETGDHLGWTVSARPGKDAEEDTTDGMVVGAPGEDVGSAAEAGYAYLLYDRPFGPPTSTPILPVGGPAAGLAYGTVLGAAHLRS